MSTLCDVFLLDHAVQPGKTDEALKAAVEAAQREAVKRVGEELPGLAPALGDIDAGLRKMLDVSLSDVLVSAWSTWRELRAYADPTQHPTDEPCTYAVGTHTISSEHHPRLELALDGKPLPALVFDVELALDIERCELSLRGGRIRSMRLGQAAVRGTLGLAGRELLRCESRPIPLPASLDFGDGIPIPV